MWHKRTVEFWQGSVLVHLTQFGFRFTRTNVMDM